MGKKIIYFVTRWDDALWERKSKAGGNKIKSRSIIYTPGCFPCCKLYLVSMSKPFLHFIITSSFPRFSLKNSPSLKNKPPPSKPGKKIFTQNLPIQISM